MPNKLTMAEARLIALLAPKEADKLRDAERERERRIAGAEEALDVPAGSDFRSPLAKARDKFMESDDGKRLCEPSLLRGTHESQYLRNRIERAWLLGVEYGEKHPCPNAIGVTDAPVTPKE